MPDKTNKESFEDLLNKRKEDDEDGDQNFIKFDGEAPEKPAEKRSKVFDNIKNALQNAFKRLEGVRPESNQQRNLDRETGGLEAEADKGVSDEDAWDDRAKQVMGMIDDAQELNNASTSSREQSFIHMEKQKKRHNKRNQELAKEGAGFVDQLNQLRKARVDKSGVSNDGQGNNNSQGGGMSL